MRFTNTLATTACAGLLLAGVGRPALAQSPTSTGTQPTGQTTAAVPAAPTPDLPLTIPTPSNMTVQVEMDLHDDDLLGVFKSLLRGVGQAANTVPVSPRTPVASQRGPTDAQIAAILSNADLSDVFKDVTHVHFVMLSAPDAAPVAPVLKPGSAKATAPVPAAPSLPDQTSFYETAFSGEGGHRIIYVNTDPVHVLMTSFGHAHGFAFMVQAPGTLAVFRADGYPDLSKLAALATSIGAAAGKVALNLPTSKLTEMMQIDQDYLAAFLTGLLNTPSPTGDAERGIAYTEAALCELGLETKRTVKGALVATVEGRSSGEPRAVTAHVDTLGAMVKEIKPNGRLVLTQIGGYPWNAIEGEGVTIATEGLGTLRGTVQLVKASSHVHGGAVNDTKREAAALEVRIDARTANATDTRALGIAVGDFVYLDPRVEQVNGFVRSRHLDDKASVACVLAAVKALRDAGQTPAQRTTLHISNYEEVGHGGASGFPADLVELLTVDMAAIGDGQTSDEFHCTLCVKDSGGPYHIDMGRKLRRLAADNGIDLKVDIYPYYGSDGEALWRAGADVRVALIGPGVDASHSYERTHTDALVDTAKLIGYYLLTD